MNNKTSEIHPYWGDADYLSVENITSILLNHNPESRSDLNKVAGYKPIKTALVEAITHNQINSVPDMHIDPFGEFPDLSKVEVASLKRWLELKGRKDNFFFKNTKKSDEFRTQDSKFYAPKLAAALDAWSAVSANPPNNKTTKQALMQWLKKNAGRYELDPSSKIVLEEIAKIANWSPGGGAPKTS